MNEIYFPHGVWMHIRSYMPIWKNAYNRVMAKIPHYNKIYHNIYTSATKPIRFKKEISRHHFIGRKLSENIACTHCAYDYEYKGECCCYYCGCYRPYLSITYELIPPTCLLIPCDPILDSGGFGQFELY